MRQKLDNRIECKHFFPIEIYSTDSEFSNQTACKISKNCLLLFVVFMVKKQILS